MHDDNLLQRQSRAARGSHHCIALVYPLSRTFSNEQSTTATGLGSNGKTTQAESLDLLATSGSRPRATAPPGLAAFCRSHLNSGYGGLDPIADRSSRNGLDYLAVLHADKPDHLSIFPFHFVVSAFVLFWQLVSLVERAPVAYAIGSFGS